MIRKHFSIIFAVIVFAALSIFATPVRAQAMDSTEVALILRDSENAHMTARLAIDAVECIVATLVQEVAWTPQDCMDRFLKEMVGLNQEHQLLAPRMKELLKEIPNRRRS